MPSPTIQERAAAIVADQQAAHDRRAAMGFNMRSGLSEPYPKVERVEDVVARLEADRARAQAFRRTPRGRFLTCVDELQEIGAYEFEALRLRGFYNRSITTLNAVDPDPSAVGACIAILVKINTSTARQGISALADLLVETQRVAA